LIILQILMVSHGKARIVCAGIIDRFSGPRLRGGRCLVIATTRPTVLGAEHTRAGGYLPGLANALIAAIEKSATVVDDNRFPAVHIVARSIPTGAGGSTNRQ
jgi:hypothetical protein